jgi:hypothetical protein
MSMPIDGIEYTAKGDRVRLVKRATPNALLVELTDNNAGKKCKLCLLFLNENIYFNFFFFFFFFFF